jgi:hypothetical protein
MPFSESANRAYFGGRGGGDEQDTLGYIDANGRAILGRPYAADPATLESVLKYVAPELG